MRVLPEGRSKERYRKVILNSKQDLLIFQGINLVGKPC